MAKLEIYIADTPIEKLKSKWNKLLNKKELKKTKNSLTGLNPKAGENFLEQINKIRTSLEENQISKGFFGAKRSIYRRCTSS
ncbi:MAG: hypothetical protein ACRBFS_10180 [Aureispira sp.]